MRIPTSLAFERITASIRNNSRQLTSIAEKLSTGKRITRPSDDVAVLSQVLHDRVSLTVTEQLKRNVAAAKSDLDRIERIMSASQETVTSMRQIVMRVVGGGEPAGSGSSAAALADGLCEQLLTFANSSFAQGYVFSGNASNRQAFNPQTLVYEGDGGTRSVILDDGVTLPVNIPGNYAFGVPPPADSVVSLSDGSEAHYITHPDSSITVEIRTADGATVLDSFSFSNAIQLCSTAADAISSGDRRKAEALLAPLEEVRDRMVSVRTEVGVRLSRMDTQDEMLEHKHTALSALISRVEDADPAETAVELAQAERALQAMRETATKIFSKSLFDFLR